MDELIKKHQQINWDALYRTRQEGVPDRTNGDKAAQKSAELTKEVVMKYDDFKNSHYMLVRCEPSMYQTRNRKGATPWRSYTNEELFDLFIKETYGNENK